MSYRLRREGGRVWLPDVRSWSPSEKHSSVHAAEESVLRALGETITYTDLVGVSALAFRMQVSKQGLCPSSPHPACGFQCLKGSLDASPWALDTFQAKPDESERIAAGRGAVVDAIDRGRPAFYGTEEDGVIVGYESNGDAWVCYHPLHNWGQELFVETSWPWGLAVPRERKTEIESRFTLAKRSLEQALAMASAVEAGQYNCGTAGWERYIHALREYREIEARTDRVTQMGNAWIYCCLAGYRKCAAEYLRAVAADFPSGAHPHLQSAATQYETIASRILRDEKQGPGQIAPFPSPNSPPWSDALRREQIRRLEAARDVERQALLEIEQVLRFVS